MGDITGFMKFERKDFQGRPIEIRLHDYREVYEHVPTEVVREQGARCMDCGVPFCHSGCPLGNLIPDWNDLVYRDRWEKALDQLHRTNNFPEFTGHVCPAPCEGSCVLGITSPPVSIKMVELSIIERGFKEGWIRPEPAKVQTGKKVAVVGSGPAGLAAAQQLARMGHSVTVFEKADRIGGLLRYGIPDFKLEKPFIDRRLEQMAAEGVVFKTGVNVGESISATDLQRDFDAVLLSGGAQHPRDLQVEGRALNGVMFAVDFLTQQNKRVAGDEIDPAVSVLASGKHVIVIGGGDTGSDCVGTSLRHGAASVTSFELMPQPPETRSTENPWPQWPLIFRTSSSHEEGGERRYNVMTKRLVGDANGNVKEIHAVQVQWQKDANGRMQMSEVPGSEFVLPADLVLLAMGFLGPIKNGMLEQLGVALDARGNVVSDSNKMTSVPGIFTAGDMTRGQSLVVWAIMEGRQAADGINQYLMNPSGN